MADDQTSNAPFSTPESRRSAIKKAGIGAAALWTAPTILSATVAAAASGGGVTNLAPAGVASQSSIDFGGPPSHGNDGNTACTYSLGSVFHTANGANEWWEVDLGAPHLLSSIVLFNRCDCCISRAQSIDVLVDGVSQGIVPGTIPPDPGYGNWIGGAFSASLALSVTGQVVRVVNGITDWFHLAEVQVFGT